MSTTPQTPWRLLGDVPLSVFLEEFLRLGSPMTHTVMACHEAAKPHSALALAMMFMEQKYGTLSSIPANRHNPLSLAKPNGTPAMGNERWEQYATWADGIRAWQERVCSPTYKGGVYAKTTSLEDVIRVYAPGRDNNDEARYVAVLCERLNAWGVTPKEQTMPDQKYNFDPSRVAWPTMLDLSLDKPAGWGWSWCEDRLPLLIGTVEHETQGVPVPGGDSIAWYHQFFGPKGERARNALVDAIIDRDGRAAWFNNPYASGRYKEPWASGGGDGYEGDGVAFIRKYGSTQNRRCLSTEMITKDGQRLTDEQIETIAQLMAKVHHLNKCPWDRFPFNPNHGLVLDFGHYELSSSSCRLPDPDVQLYQNRARAILKAGQINEHEDVTPPPTPIVNPANDLLPDGWTNKIAAERFGELVRFNTNGSRDTFTFDPKGPISNMWLRRGWDQGGSWGEAGRWLVLKDGETTRDLIFFGDGSVLTRSGNHQWAWSGDLEDKPNIKVA